jgi:hypothetical protein
MTVRLRINERGTTLPLVLLVIVLLGLGLAFSFRRTGAELRTYSDQQAQVDASVIAQAGIAQFLAGLSAIPSSGTMDTTVSVGGASATISLRRIRDSAGIPGDIFVVLSRGTSTGSTRYTSEAPTAEHSIAQILTVATGKTTMAVAGAVTSLNGITHSGAKAAVDGNDAQKAAGYPGVLPGIAVPNGGYVPGANGIQIQGNPNGAPAYMGTQAQMAAATGIDWAGITGGSITPDYTYANCSSLPYSMASYPIVVVTGDCTISGGVEFDGTLIVLGNLTLNHGGSGDPQMRGIMLVGQNFNGSAGPQGWGAVVSGLNVLVPSMPQPSGPDQWVGGSQYWWDSYEVNKAMSRFNVTASSGTFTIVRNAVADNIPSF